MTGACHCSPSVTRTEGWVWAMVTIFGNYREQVHCDLTTHHSATDCCDYEGSSIMTDSDTVVNTQTQNWGTLVTTATRYCPRHPHLATLISGHLAGVPGHHTVILSYPPRTWIWPNSCVLLTKWSLWQIAGQNRPTHDSLSDQHLYMELIFCIGIHKNPKYLSVSHCSHETVSSLQLPGTGKSHIMTHDMTSVMWCLLEELWTSQYTLRCRRVCRMR